MSLIPFKNLGRKRLLVPLLVGVFYLVPVLVSTYQLFAVFEKDIEFAKKEISGIEYLEPLAEVIFVCFDKIVNKDLDQKGWIESLTLAFDRLEERHRDIGKYVGADKTSLYIKGKEEFRVKKMRNLVNDLRDNTDHPSTENELIVSIIELALGLMVHVGDSSNLILDPDLDSYYLMDVIIVTVPKFLRNILRFNQQLFDSGDLSGINNYHRHVASSLIRFDTIDGVKEKIASVLREDAHFYGTSPTLAGRISTPFQDFLAQISALSDDLGAESNQYQEVKTRQNYLSTLTKTKIFWGVSLKELKVLLQIRLKFMEDAKNKHLIFSAFIWIICFVLTLSIVISMKVFQKDLETALDLLREQSLRREMALKGALDGIITIDTMGKVLEFNPAAQNIFGYNESETIGRELAELIIPEQHRAAHTGALKNYLTKGRQDPISRRVRIQGIKKDGKELPLELSLLAVHFPNKAPEFTAFVRDLSQEERLQRESKLQQSRLVVASRLSSLGEVAGGIAHEIKNPLAIIDGNLQKIKAHLEKSPEKQVFEKSIETMRLSVTRITKIIDGLRKFSRSGESDPFESVSLKKVIEESIEFCMPKIKMSNIDLRVFCHVNGKVEARSVQISQVLINLINNSVDAISGTSHPWIEIDLLELPEWCHITVTDSGRGIPKAVAAKIMQPFFTTKAVGKGTGLGLSISLGIIQDHGGDLVLDQDSPHTRFIIKLPCHQGQGVKAA